VGYLANSLRGASRGPGEALNILTAPTHERWESSLALTGHRFWAVRSGNVKDWNTSYAPVPDNYHVLSRDAMPPDHVVIDLVLAQNRFGQYQLLEPLARRLHAPLATVEHTTVMPTWPGWYITKMKSMRGHANAFITETSRKAWGWGPGEADVLPHGVDSALFRPDDGPRRPVLLSVVNDWVNRDMCMPAGQQVLTELGYMPIETVAVGQKVLASNGRYYTVTNTFRRLYRGPLYTFRLDCGRLPIRFTANHPIRVRRNGQWAYLEASRVGRGDVLFFPKLERTDWSMTDKEFAWLFGLVVGDGSATKGGTVNITVHENERGIAERARQMMERITGYATISERHRRTGKKAISVETTARVFASWVRRHMGERSYEKRFPDFIMGGSDDVRIEALRGLWAADGHVRCNGNNLDRLELTTISVVLASQVSSLMHHFGIKCSIEKRIKKIKGRGGHALWSYRVIAYGQDNVERGREILEGDKPVEPEPYSYKVSEAAVDTDWAGEVYNIEVAEDNSYVVYPGFLVHNCCGYRYWQEATGGLPVRVVGNTPGLSLPADGVEGLAEEYRRATVFVNTSQHSPVPMALLEAMSSGCAVVSAATCEVPEVITDGVNGLLCGSPAEMRAKCVMALGDPSLCERLGREARRTVRERFSMERFVENWGSFLRRAAAAVPYQDGSFV